MKNSFAEILDETVKTWSRIANEVFPPHIHCAFCLRALAKFDGSARFCPHCKFPLY